MENGDQVKTGSRTELIFLTLVFTLPFLGGWLVYNHVQTGGESEGRLYGMQIEPPPVISDIKLSGIGAGAENQHTLHGKWSLVYYLTGECGPVCHADLEMLRKLRLVTASNADKIQLVLVSAKTGDEAISRELAADLNTSNIFIIQGEDALEISIAIQGATRPGDRSEDDIYMINPSGGIILHYGDNREGEGILNDLKHLFQNPEYGQH